MLFSKASVQQASVVNSILESFCYFLGQKINFSKSQFFFSLSTPSAITDQICTRLGFCRVDNLGSYLGLCLLHVGWIIVGAIFWSYMILL